MKKIITLSLLILLIKTGFAQSWVKKADLTDSVLAQYGSSYGISGGTSFSIGDTGYIVTGANGFSFFHDTWIYDYATNTWDTVAAFPYNENGTGGGVKAGFALNGKGYVGTGSFFGLPLTKEFYEYDPATNTWSPKAFMSVQRGYGIGFAISGRGFIGLGDGGVNVGTFGPPLHDVWEYNPNTGDSGTWTQILDYPGEGNQLCFAFTIGDKAYVGGGINQNTNQACDDFWEYDTINATWTRVATFPGGPRSQGASVNGCSKGYIGLGQNSSNTLINDFWEFDPNKGDSGTWTQIATIPIPPGRSTPEAFAIGKSIFTGMGSNSNGAVPDLWQYTPSVTPGFTISPTTLCAGQPVTFTDTSNYGPTNWEWSFSGVAPDTSSSQNPEITFDTSGTYSITLTAWNGCDSGTATVSQYITINPAPPLPTFPKDTSECGTFSLMLNSGSTGFTYLWSTGDTTHNLAVTKLGTYWLNIYSTCDTISDTINVKGDTSTTLTISPAAPFVCSDATITLYVSGGGSGFIWQPATGLADSTLSGDSVLAAPTATVTYTVSGTDSIGCPGTGTDVVTVSPAPNKPTISVSVTGDSLISSATTDNQWYFDGQPINGANSQVLIITGHAKGYFSVSVTNEANGCSTTSDSTTSINEVSSISNQISIYPNPFNTYVTIRINSSVTNVDQWNLQLIDVLGRTLYTNSSLNYSNELDLSDLPGGVYFITIINKTDRAVFPVVKQN